MMGKNYHKETNRSRREVQELKGHTVTVEMADGKACFQMVLPMNEMLFDLAQAIEETASKAGLLMVKATSSSPDARWRWKGRVSVRLMVERFRC